MYRKAEVTNTSWQAFVTPPGSENRACTYRGNLGTREIRRVLDKLTGRWVRRNRKGAGLYGNPVNPIKSQFAETQNINRDPGIGGR